MTTKQILKKGVIKCIKELFNKVDNSSKDRTPEEDKQILRNYFRNHTLAGAYNNSTDTTEHVAVFVPKEIGSIIKKYLDIPKDERKDVGFDYTFEFAFDTGGGVAFLRMPYNSDDGLPKPCLLLGSLVIIQNANKTAERKGVDDYDIIEDGDADNTFVWRFYLA
jgi:hypothetical protein